MLMLCVRLRRYEKLVQQVADAHESETKTGEASQADGKSSDTAGDLAKTQLVAQAEVSTATEALSKAEEDLTEVLKQV